MSDLTWALFFFGMAAGAQAQRFVTHLVYRI